MSIFGEYALGEQIVFSYPPDNRLLVPKKNRFSEGKCTTKSNGNSKCTYSMSRTFSVVAGNVTLQDRNSSLNPSPSTKIPTHDLFSRRTAREYTLFASSAIFMIDNLLEKLRIKIHSKLKPRKDGRSRKDVRLRLCWCPAARPYGEVEDVWVDIVEKNKGIKCLVADYGNLSLRMILRLIFFLWVLIVSVNRDEHPMRRFVNTSRYVPTFRVGSWPGNP